MNNIDLYRGRGWARVGFWVGSSASVAANIAHAFISLDPSWLLVFFAVLPPFALLVGVEVIAQVRWRKVWYQAVIRWGAVGTVAGIGGVISYDHMRAALAAHGETGVGSILLPLMIDGLMTVCSAALLTIGDNVRRAERDELPPEVAQPKATELPAEGRPKQAPRKPVAKVAAKPAKTTPRRPVAETKALATQALASSSSSTRKDVAEQLDITPRRLRQVLNEDTGEQVPVMGPFVPQDEMPAAQLPVNGTVPASLLPTA